MVYLVSMTLPVCRTSSLKCVIFRPPIRLQIYRIILEHFCNELSDWQLERLQLQASHFDQIYIHDRWDSQNYFDTAAIIAMVTLLLTTIGPTSSYYQASVAILGKMYSNSMMVLLNNRLRISSDGVDLQRWSGPSRAENIQLSNLRFDSETTTQEMEDLTSRRRCTGNLSNP